MNTVAHHPTPAKHRPLARLAAILRRRPVPVQHPYLQSPEDCRAAGHPLGPVPTADPATGWCPACAATMAMPRVAA